MILMYDLINFLRKFDFVLKAHGFYKLCILETCVANTPFSPFRCIKMLQNISYWLGLAKVKIRDEIKIISEKKSAKAVKLF